jgi:tRNA modification GTPase
MPHPDLSATIVALATPPGVGAIAVFRLSGPRAIELTDRLFSGKRSLLDARSHTVQYGYLRDAADGRLLDEVVVSLFRGPRSYTGEDVVEISCHGSPYIQQQVLQAFLARGARLAQPGEFTLRAFLNGRLDLSQAEAVGDLIASESETAHQLALHQLRGGFRTEIARLREQLVHFASLVELELDFGEEDVEFADRPQLKSLVGTLRQYLRNLLESFTLGNALKNGVITVIAGRPNAGKSTLLNALLNEDRAIVSDIPGTTRDTVEEVLNIKGVQFRLIDTAGLREAQDQIEAIGVQRTMEKIRQAAVLVYVWDISALTLPEVYEDLHGLTHDDNQYQLLVVGNKMDRNPYFQADWLLDPTTPGVHPYLLGIAPGEVATDDDAQRAAANIFPLKAEQIVPVSAKNQQNIEYLKEKLFETVAGGAVRPDTNVVTNARHYDALLRADGALADVLTGLETGVTGDFVAQDIRRALMYLGEITGEIGVEDLLENIFSRFCIGK